MQRNHVLAVGIAVFILLCLTLQVVVFHSFQLDGRRRFTWGLPFQGYPLQSFNVKMDCQWNGNPLCCALTDDPLTSKNPVSNLPAGRLGSALKRKRGNSCYSVRSYQPSPYELRHIAEAKALEQMVDEEERRDALRRFIFEDLSSSMKWLRRVELHMRSSRSPSLSEDDMEYLSRFRVSETCTDKETGKQSQQVWYEWIEPLTLHARHPFAIADCIDSGLSMDWNASLGSHGIAWGSQFFPLAHSNFTLMNTDYVLLQSGEALPSAESRRSILFDVGTSTFDSSLFWFLCAYLQRSISFDSIYGWEQTLLEPNDFWRRVPKSVLPYYHFFNTPVSSSSSTAPSSASAGYLSGEEAPPVSSIVEMLQRVATPEDFVALKLDIDTPSVEIPIVLQILQRSDLAAYVDELFFELHFRCEFLMYCGWGETIPRASNGLQLDRFHVLLLFQQLRELGIRAHFWP